MAKRREISEGKKNIIAGLLEEYDIQSAGDIQEALKDLLGGTIQSMMEVDTLVDSIIVYDSEHIEIKWKYADEYLSH